MDCDDVVLVLARDAGGLSDAEADAFDAHVAGCETCFALVRDRRAAVAPGLELQTIDPASFEIGEVIASGGMGRISRAFDRRLGRVIAVKEVLAPELRARFEREARITARLQHPAIVPIYEAGTWPDGTAFYTMRLVPGETLADAISRRTSLAERLALLPHVIAVTEAVAYAHARGVIHRDLKPHNVLIGEFGETVVIDWGLAKERGGAEEPVDGDVKTAPLTSLGTVVGTPCFMAPEQARGEEIDERADVFALGALLYHLIAGSPPYWDSSHDSSELIDAVRARPPTSLAALVPATPADLRAIVEHAMARDRADRYPDAGAVADELRRFAAGQLLASREYRLRDLLARWIRKHRALVAGSAAALVVLGVVAGVAIRNLLRANAAERAAATAFQRGQQALCATSIPRLATPWTAEARALAHQRFERQELAYVPETLARIDTNLARWSVDLDAAKQQICDRPGTELAAQLACLADRTREARALISQFHDADKATVLNAIGATEQLTPIAQCTRIAPRRAPVAESAALTSVHDLFAKSHALLELGKAKDALPLTEQAMKEADAIGDPALRAAARVAQGAALSGTGEADRATAILQEAVQLAELGHDDRSRAQAWTNLIRIEYQRGRFERAVFLQPVALGAAERIDDVFLQTEMMLFLGGALGQLGKNPEAQALFERAVAMRRKAYGDRDRRLANALSSLGNAHAMKGNLDAGITAHRDAAAISEAALGATHPNVGVMYGNLGSDYLYGLRTDDAIATFQKSLAIAEGAYGRKHRDTAIALTNLGTACYVAGLFEDAKETFIRAEAVWRELNPKHPMLAEVLVGIHLAQRAMGKPAEVADLETALELAKGLPPFIRARVQLALGKAVTGPRARELVKAAAEGFATSTLPLTQRELADAKAWLAEHP